MKQSLLSKIIVAVLYGCAVNAQTSENTDNPLSPTVVGDVFIVPNSLSYVGDTNDTLAFTAQRIEQSLGIKLQPNNVLVQVWATSIDDENTPVSNRMITAKEGAPITTPLVAGDKDWRAKWSLASKQGKSDNWADHGHPVLGSYVFPSALPLYMLEGKKEGDIIHLMITNDKGQQIPVALRCKQNGYRYGSHRFGKDFEGMVSSLKESFACGPNYSYGHEAFLIERGILNNHRHGPYGFDGSDKDPGVLANNNVAAGSHALEIAQSTTYKSAVAKLHNLRSALVHSPRAITWFEKNYELESK